MEVFVRLGSSDWTKHGRDAASSAALGSHAVEPRQRHDRCVIRPPRAGRPVDDFQLERLPATIGSGPEADVARGRGGRAPRGGLRARRRRGAARQRLAAGTFLAGQEVQEAVLRDGDVMELGRAGRACASTGPTAGSAPADAGQGRRFSDTAGRARGAADEPRLPARAAAGGRAGGGGAGRRCSPGPSASRGGCAARWPSLRARRGAGRGRPPRSSRTASTTSASARGPSWARSTSAARARRAAARAAGRRRRGRGGRPEARARTGPHAPAHAGDRAPGGRADHPPVRRRRLPAAGHLRLRRRAGRPARLRARRGRPAAARRRRRAWWSTSTPRAGAPGRVLRHRLPGRAGGLVLTNRHLAEPWWSDEEAEALEKQGYKPQLIDAARVLPPPAGRLRAEGGARSQTVDLALLRVNLRGAQLPVLPLARDGRGRWPASRWWCSATRPGWRPCWPRPSRRW